MSEPKQEIIIILYYYLFNYFIKYYGKFVLKRRFRYGARLPWQLTVLGHVTDWHVMVMVG